MWAQTCAHKLEAGFWDSYAARLGVIVVGGNMLISLFSMLSHSKLAWTTSVLIEKYIIQEDVRMKFIPLQNIRYSTML